MQIDFSNYHITWPSVFYHGIPMTGTSLLRKSTSSRSLEAT